MISAYSNRFDGFLSDAQLVIIGGAFLTPLLILKTIQKHIVTYFFAYR